MPGYLNQNDLDTYYGYFGLKPIVCKSIFEFGRVLHSKGERIVLSNSFFVRCFSKLFRTSFSKLNDELSKIEFFYSFCDALDVLNRKGVAVYFYNRVALKKDGFIYSDSATRRINNNQSFTSMIANVGDYKSDWDELVGKDYNEDYLDKLKKIPQIIKKGNVYCHEDISSELVNVIEGKRKTTFLTNSSNKKNIHIYGRCGAFGYAVSDNETFPSQLQKLLTDNNDDYKVINHGLWGGEDYYILHNFFFDVPSIREGDIVLFYMRHFDKNILPMFIKKGLYYKEITDLWHQFPEAKWCFYDKPGHMNNVGYRNLASIIYDDLKKNGFIVQESEASSCLDARYLNSYLKTHGDVNFEVEVKKYIDNILYLNPELKKTDGRIGSIVMNCNPFTFGHRYLIEQASKQVDRLIIFVVEEDKSFFKFEDRFQMVKEGVEGLQNISVIPSGNFIISTITFPEYFLKDYVKEKNFDLSQDLEVFCNMIAPSLGISVRFAGEEPFDPVTKNYNENMAVILPKYGLEFIEIPRKATDDTNEIINATKVRELIKDKNLDQLKRFIPLTTLNIILDKYI